MVTLSIAPVLDVVGIAIGLLLALLLCSSPRGNRPANHWLAVYVAVLTLLSVGDLLDDSRWVLSLPHLAHLADWAIFLVGPLLWMYVRRLTLNERPQLSAWLLHTIPAALVFASLLPFYLLSAADKLPTITAELARRDSLMSSGLLLAAVQMFAYWSASLWTLRRYSQALRQRYSSVERRDFRWLRAMLIVNIVMWCCWLVGLSTQHSWAEWFDLLAVPAGLYLLAILGLRQPAVFTAPELQQWAVAKQPAEQLAEADQPADRSGRYRRSGLDRARVPEMMIALDQLMAQQKPWLENDLTLPQLAQRAGLSPHHLSQLLNEARGETFFDFVNTRRVLEVQRCLADPAYQSQSLLEIALASGFNSKGAFNAAFRRHSGMSPSQFRRQSGSNTQ